MRTRGDERCETLFPPPYFLYRTIFLDLNPTELEVEKVHWNPFNVLGTEDQRVEIFTPVILNGVS